MFNSLLNRKFVKGHLNVMDKNPNWDGILELTDAENYPVGKIQVQLKTLRSGFANNPRHQLDLSFFGSCEFEALPGFIIVVDVQNKIAYWRHIDRITLQEVKEKIVGNSYLLTIPIENRLDGKDEAYIVEWTKIARETSNKVWNYESMAHRQREIEEQLSKVNTKLQNPVNLPLYALKEIHDFLDEYNYILDKEFAAIKRVIYPDYWKIGMAVLEYQLDNARFFLYPVEYDKSQLMIKEFEPGYDIFTEMARGNVLLFAAGQNRESLTYHRSSYSYQLLEKDVMRVAGVYNFPLSDLSLACEFLISFIDKYHQYLDLDKDLELYSIKELKYKLYKVIPMVVATNHHFAEWVVDYDHNIDSYDTYKAREGHKKRISEAIEKVEQDFQPKVQVRITSAKYNIDLINYYIDLLESKGFSNIQRRYKAGQRDETMYNVDLWRTWKKEVLWNNVQLFFAEFYRLYNGYIQANFPNIEQHLRIINSNETTVVNVFYSEGNQVPHVKICYLRPEILSEGEILTLLAEDINNPIDYNKILNDDWSCVFNSKRYRITQIQSQPLDFMFTDLPTYSLINYNLKEQLKVFFRKRTRKSLSL